MNDPQADPDALPKPSTGVLDRALSLVEFLRANCPWDAAQTHTSLRRYLLEEAHEVVTAIDKTDDDGIREEVGDLLLNIAFQIVLGEERAAFDREDVVQTLEQKMRRRHPHLYGDGKEVGWERLKAIERGDRDGTAGDGDGDGQGDVDGGGILDDLVSGVDPIAYAFRIQAKVAEVGFDWANASGAWAKLREEIEEVGVELETGTPSSREEEIGDLLFAAVNLARLSEVHPSVALHRANAKFARRFRRVEELAQASGMKMEDAGLEALDRLWDQIKREER